jgi:response regulator RpfG family c-di-GMP phosphodiesterase
MNDSEAIRVLFVDDEPAILKALNRLFRKADFETRFAADPDEALSLVRETSFAVVVSDQKMPRMEGTVLLEKVKDISPDTIRIILTGYADINAAVEAINRGSVYRFLTKPWNDQELRTSITQAVDQYRLILENRRLNDLTARQNEELKQLNLGLEKKVEERTRDIRVLNQKLEDSFIGSVRVMAELTEMSRSVVGKHSKRVAAVSKHLARHLSLDDSVVFGVEVAATLHDIGKLGIPPEILNKPEHLRSRAEQELYEHHPVKGEALVKTVPHLGEVPSFVRHHHERFDGKGFPDHLKGVQIPLPSRIIAVVDAFDKALNTRSHFESATTDKAIRSLQVRAGSFFDPDIVTSLAEILTQAKKTPLGEQNEIEIRIEDLEQGMTLARDIYSARGVLLIPRKTTLRQNHLNKIHAYHEKDPIVGGIFIFRKSRPATEQESSEES